MATALVDEISRRLVDVTQQRLADGVVTAREVVARALRDLRTEGLVATRARRIEILDRDRLAALVGRWRSRPTP